MHQPVSYITKAPPTPPHGTHSTYLHHHLIRRIVGTCKCIYFSHGSGAVRSNTHTCVMLNLHKCACMHTSLITKNHKTTNNNVALCEKNSLLTFPQMYNTLSSISTTHHYLRISIKRERVLYISRKSYELVNNHQVE